MLYCIIHDNLSVQHAPHHRIARDGHLTATNGLVTRHERFRRTATPSDARRNITRVGERLRNHARHRMLQGRWHDRPAQIIHQRNVTVALMGFRPENLCGEAERPSCH